MVSAWWVLVALMAGFTAGFVLFALVVASKESGEPAVAGELDPAFRPLPESDATNRVAV